MRGREGPNRSMLTCKSSYRYLYTSRLAPGQSSGVVTALLRRARERNRELQIHGVLLFDGEHFAQLLEGDAAVVAPLARRIEADARHQDLVVMLEGMQGPPALFDRWRGGWVQPEKMAGFMAGAGGDGIARLQAFGLLVEGADVA